MSQIISPVNPDTDRGRAIAAALTRVLVQVELRKRRRGPQHEPVKQAA